MNVMDALSRIGKCVEVSKKSTVAIRICSFTDKVSLVTWGKILKVVYGASKVGGTKRFPRDPASSI